MVADDVIETASDGLVLRAVTGILSDQHELDRLAGVQIDDGCVRIQGTLADHADRIVLDDAIDVHPSSGSCSADEHQSRGDCRGDCGPDVMLHAISQAVTWFRILKTIDVRKLIAG